MSKTPIDSVPPSLLNAPHERSRQESLSQVGHESATRALMVAPVSVRLIETVLPQWDPPS